MTIEEKFYSVPCELFINTDSSPYAWFFDQDCNHFFLENKSETDDYEDYGYVETPYREKILCSFGRFFGPCLMKMISAT